MTVDNPTVAEMIADAEWPTNPAKFVAYCAQMAGDEWERGRRDSARRYASMASELVSIADNPKVEVGLVVASILSQPR